VSIMLSRSGRVLAPDVPAVALDRVFLDEAFGRVPARPFDNQTELWGTYSQLGDASAPASRKNSDRAPAAASVVLPPALHLFAASVDPAVAVTVPELSARVPAAWATASAYLLFEGLGSRAWTNEPLQPSAAAEKKAVPTPGARLIAADGEVLVPASAQNAFQLYHLAPVYFGALAPDIANTWVMVGETDREGRPCKYVPLSKVRLSAMVVTPGDSPQEATLKAKVRGDRGELVPLIGIAVANHNNVSR